MVEPLQHKPMSTDPDAWLAQVATSANQNPHLKERKLQVAGEPALRVRYQAPASEMEEVFVLFGDRTFSISFDADAAHGPLESLLSYSVFNAMVDSFRPSVGLVVAPVLPQQPSLPKGDLVWTWSKRCRGDYKLGVTVRLDSKMLYRGVFPICRGARDAEDGRAKFHFNGGHSFQGEYRTRSTDLIEGDIWQAGGEPDALILGISFDSDKQILLNTVHIARSDKQASSKLDKGLFITTYPVNGR